MTDKVLHLGDGFSLPADEFIEAKFGVLGQSGRGKTGLVRRTLEECHRVGLPFVVMDPSSILWGLRSSYDGKGEGIPVVVIGGDHADVRLEKTAGAEVARSIVAANVSCVVDLGAESKTTYRTFAKDFAETLFTVNDAPRLVVLDEAPELVPQSLTGRPDLAVTYDAVERLVRQGRNKGIGVMLVSQRAATISKDVLTQCGSLFVFGLVGTPDRKALREWVSAYGGENKLHEFEEGLASLERRECWFWSPSEFHQFRKLRVSDFHTFHPDRTHLRRLGLLDAKPVTTDVSGIVAKLGKQLERLSKEKTDTKRIPGLEAQVRRLEAELAREKQHAAVHAVHTIDVGEKVKQVQAAVQTATAPLRQEIAQLRHALHAANRRVGSARGLAEQILQLEPMEVPAGVVPPLTSPPARGNAVPETPAKPRPVVVRTAPPREPLPTRATDAGGEEGEEYRPKAGEIRMLQELASRHPLTLTYSQLATLAGFTPSGGTSSTYFGRLRKAGLLEEDRQGNVTVTQAGIDFIGADIPPAPSTHEETMTRWSRNLKAGCFKMLQVVAGRYPEPITNDELASAAGFTREGGTYGTYRSILARNGLIEITGDEIRAAAILYPEDSP